MIINEAFYYYSRKTLCKVDDGTIKSLPYSINNKMAICNPFEGNNASRIPLYATFASIKNEEDIIHFIEKYGFLGLHFDTLKNKNWLEYTTTILKDISYLNTYTEDVKEFLKEVSLMRCILELIEEFNNNTLQIAFLCKNLTSTDESERISELESKIDYSSLQIKIDNVYLYNGRQIKDDITNASNHPRLVAPDLIIKEIEIKLSSINLRLVYEQREFVENRFAHNLLTAIYLMLYEDLTTGKRPAKCNNKTCNAWFLIDTNHNKKFCSVECERAEKQRRYRENKKKKLELQNNTNKTIK